MPRSRRIVDAVHSENIQRLCLVLMCNGSSVGHDMTKYLGLLVTLGVFATIGLVAAQNSRPTAQNLAVEAAPPPAAPAAAPVPPPASDAEKRIALVIGYAGYQAGALKTAANDAGLIAQTLQAAGFDVVGARDLDEDALRRTLRDFLGKAA